MLHTEYRTVCSHSHPALRLQHGAKERDLTQKLNKLTPGPHSQCEVSRVDLDHQEASISENMSGFKGSTAAQMKVPDSASAVLGMWLFPSPHLSGYPQCNSQSIRETARASQQIPQTLATGQGGEVTPS